MKILGKYWWKVLLSATPAGIVIGVFLLPYVERVAAGEEPTSSSMGLVIVSVILLSFPAIVLVRAMQEMLGMNDGEGGNE